MADLGLLAVAAEYAGPAAQRALAELIGQLNDTHKRLREQSAELRRLRRHGPPCCYLHGRNCGPRSGRCCWRCTEDVHPVHADGSICSNPDLSAPQQDT